MQAGRHAEAYAAITSAVQPFIKASKQTIKMLLPFCTSFSNLESALE